VVVFSAGPAGDEGPLHGAKAAVRYLARHGVAAETLHATVSDERAGETILARARKAGADLVVMGAYGRSRMTELILGGATRAVLRSGSIAVLMSH
jgi:nucleotide-binding universal stress UspA family protein